MNIYSIHVVADAEYTQSNRHRNSNEQLININRGRSSSSDLVVDTLAALVCNVISQEFLFLPEFMLRNQPFAEYVRERSLHTMCLYRLHASDRHHKTIAYNNLSSHE